MSLAINLQMMVPVLMSVLAFLLIQNGSFCCQPSAPQIVLQELHNGCNNDKKSRHPECVAAMHRFCARVSYPTPITTLGISREHINQYIGMSCVQSHWSGDVSISTLKRHHNGCETHKSQHRECLSAIHRYCIATLGEEFAGVSQEVPSSDRLYVHCFHSSRKEDVRHDVLSSYHGQCRFPESQSSQCFSASSRWCRELGHSGGVTQEVNNHIMTIACYDAEFSNDVFVIRNTDFYNAQTRIRYLCSLNFAVDRGQILSTTPEILAEQLYDNSQSSVPLMSTFSVSKAVTQTNSFTHEKFSAFSVSSQVSANLPYVSAGVTVSASTSTPVSLTQTNMETITYSHSSTFNVPPRHAIMKQATITRATLRVPWSAVVVDGLGHVMTLHGQWNGVTTYGLRVTQRDVMESDSCPVDDKIKRKPSTPWTNNKNGVGLDIICFFSCLLCFSFMLAIFAYYHCKK